MMKIIVAGIILLFLSSFSCSHDDGCIRMPAGKETVMVPHHVYCSDEITVSLELGDINDSRCPEGVICIWEGEVAVEIFSSGQTEGRMLLKSQSQPADTLGNYVIELLEVNPYPKYKHPLEYSDYRVTVKISRLN